MLHCGALLYSWSGGLEKSGKGDFPFIWVCTWVLDGYAGVGLICSSNGIEGQYREALAFPIHHRTLAMGAGYNYKEIKFTFL